jgi:hypothetical protein
VGDVIYKHYLIAKTKKKKKGKKEKNFVSIG